MKSRRWTEEDPNTKIFHHDVLAKDMNKGIGEHPPNDADLSDASAVPIVKPNTSREERYRNWPAVYSAKAILSSITTFIDRPGVKTQHRLHHCTSFFPFPHAPRLELLDREDLHFAAYIWRSLESAVDSCKLGIMTDRIKPVESIAHAISRKTVISTWEVCTISSCGSWTPIVDPVAIKAYIDKVDYETVISATMASCLPCLLPSTLTGLTNSFTELD